MGVVHNAIENLFNEYDVARITGLSVASVRRWRLLRQGPKYLKIGAAVRYRPEDLASWLATRPTGGSDDDMETIPSGAFAGLRDSTPMRAPSKESAGERHRS
jgi:hypothetical protein